MLVKKLAVPLINEKVLAQAEYCHIATAGISDEAFDFVASRLPVKCKVEMLTGLDEVTSPKVLWRIWKHFTDRVALRIHTRSAFHANVYIFDLPFRKSVAYVGSGALTMDGLKDREEVFYKVTDPKEIEALKSWFIGFYEYGESIGEEIIHQYDLVYPSLMQKVITSRREKEDAVALAGFRWDQIKFKNQFFKREDYFVLANDKARLASPVIQAEREQLRDKFLQLHELIKRDVGLLKLTPVANALGSIGPDRDGNVKTASNAYGRRESDFEKFALHVTPDEFQQIKIVLMQRSVSLRLAIGVPGIEGIDRANFHQRMNDEPYRETFFKNLIGLGAPYWIEIAGKRVDVTTFKDHKSLHHFTQSDDHRFSDFSVGRDFYPGDAAIGQDQIATTLAEGMGKLAVIYEQVKKT